ncbi:MAG: hypothetical protein WC511_01110 [Candidatus Pacearchaeota archaeon]
MEKFESPQQEALEIALESRRKLLDGKEDIISVLRSCLVVANNLSKEEEIKWIKNELNGEFNKIPSYRKISCLNEDEKLEDCDVPFEIKLLYNYSHNERMIKYGKITIRPVDCSRIIDGVTNKCLFFLNDSISELLYGGYIQSFFERIRKEVDKKIISLNSNIPQELESIYRNLISKNPTDYSKVALSCRKILKIIADKVFPAQEQKYKTKDGREWEVKDPNFRNRLLCFLDKNSTSEISKSQCELMEKYLKDVVEETQDGVHKDLSNYEASMIALHTYLIASEVLMYIS